MNNSKSARLQLYAKYALRALEKVLGSNFSISGLENLKDNSRDSHPVLFVANHFTRCETFFLPYIINKYSNRKIRSLAYSGLFKGSFGKFLESLGAVSTKDPKRDNIILKDLICNEHDWIIYPEGSMLKSKDIKKGKRFVSYTPEGYGPSKTGSAVLAIKSELYRRQIIKAYDKKDNTSLEYLKKEFGIEYFKSLKSFNTKIIPLTISYYPIRPGKNIINNIAERFLKEIPKEIAEELEIEGNLLLNSEININFSKPIDISDYIVNVESKISQIPIIKSQTKVDLVIKYYRIKLTYDFMSQIYRNVQINLDHLYSAALAFYPKNKITFSHLKKIIFHSAMMIISSQKYRLNHALTDNLYKILYDESFEEFDSVHNLAKLQNLVSQDKSGKITINKRLFNKEYDFHKIRIENSLFVIFNEFAILQTASDIIRLNVRYGEEVLNKKIFKDICKHDITSYEQDYNKYYDQDFSKELSVGRPFYLLPKKKNKSKIGIILCHGYKSSPKQMQPMAEFLQNIGFVVYVVRLKGHATAPVNMKDVSWQDWYESVQYGYIALNMICEKIVFLGFSTGGLLSLLSAARKNNHQNKIIGIVSINSALKLQDIRSKMVAGINLWNDLLTKFDVTKGKLEYIDDVPENPETNYSRNYLHGVEELGKLMNVCEKNLGKITQNTLVIQGKNDNIVNPKSGKIVYNNIKSQHKTLYMPDFNYHSIICSDRKEEIFVKIKDFLKTIH